MIDLIALVKQYNLKRNLNDYVQRYRDNVDNIKRIEGTIARLGSTYDTKIVNMEKALGDNLDDNSVKLVSNRIAQIKSSRDEQVFNLAVELRKAYNTVKDIETDILQYEENVFQYQTYLPHSIGKSREQMPQISQDNIYQYINHFSDKAKVKIVDIAASSLKPSQSEFNESKILNLLMDNGFVDRTYIVSKDNYLVDGHHAWAAQLESNASQAVRCIKVNIPIKQLLKRSNQLKISTKRDVNDVKKALLVQNLQDTTFEPKTIAVSGEQTVDIEVVKSMLLDQIVSTDSSIEEITDIFTEQEYKAMITDRSQEELEVINKCLQSKDVSIGDSYQKYYIAVK